jgi:hypothetical protein
MNQNSSDICNYYLKFFLWNLCQNSELVIIKCGSQQKSWRYLTSMLLIINEQEFKPKIIEFDYYESGHSFQAADSVHSNISTKIKNCDNIYDYNDLTLVIETSRKNLKVDHLKYNEVYIFEDLPKKKKPFNIKN